MVNVKSLIYNKKERLTNLSFLLYIHYQHCPPVVQAACAVPGLMVA